MTDARPVGVVVDTMVISWLFDQRPNPVADRYRALIGTRPVLACVSDGHGAALRGLTRRLGRAASAPVGRRIAELTVAQPDDEMISVCAELREGCRQIGHPLGDKVHDGDRWIAAAAIRLELPLASHDDGFAGAPRLELITAAPRG